MTALLAGLSVAPAGATSASAPSAPSRLYVGHELAVGSTLVAPSKHYVAKVLTGGTIEILHDQAVVWSGSTATLLKGVLARQTNGAVRIAGASNVKGHAPSSVSYLTINNDGDLALVTESGTPVWQGGVRANVASTVGVAPYSRGNLFGATNPSVTCYTCDAVAVTGSAPPSDSLDAGVGVNHLTGDFSASNTLFDAKAIGGDLSLTLSYDAQLAQSQLSAGATGLKFGEGWSSNYSSSLTIGVDANNNPNITVNQASGAEVTFAESADSGVSTSCQSSGDPSSGQYPGDYPFSAKYTIAGSTVQYCASDSTQGQLSYSSSLNDYVYQQDGGQSIQTYAWTGQLVSSTTLTAQAGTPVLGLVYGNVAAATTSITPSGGTATTLVNPCPTSAIYGCTVIMTTGGRDIVEVLNASNQVVQVIDPSGATYTLTYNANNLTAIAVPSPTGTGAATWSYGYADPAGWPYASDLTSITDPDYNPSVSSVAHTIAVTYGSGSTTPGMVTAVTDGTGATTNYAYASPCATGQCAASGSTQTTTITYPGECPSASASCTTTPPTSVAADMPREIDQYTSGLETSSQLGSSTNASESETWLYNWVLGNGVANTTETITYPNTLSAAAQARTATIVTDPAGNVVSTTNALGDVATSAYNETTSLNLPELAWSFPGPSTNTSSTPPAGSSRYTYNQYGQVLTATDPLGNTTFYGYYANYSMLCYEVSASNAARLGWTASTVPSNCTSTSTSYDAGALGAPVGSTTFSYDAYGDVTGSTTDAGDTGANADDRPAC